MVPVMKQLGMNDAFNSGKAKVKAIFDRPFITLTRDRETGTYLFMGRISDPTQQSANQQPIPNLP